MSHRHEREVEIDGINGINGAVSTDRVLPRSLCIFLQVWGTFDLQRCCSVFPSPLEPVTSGQTHD